MLQWNVFLIPCCTCILIHLHDVEATLNTHTNVWQYIIYMCPFFYQSGWRHLSQKTRAKEQTGNLWSWISQLLKLVSIYFFWPDLLHLISTAGLNQKGKRNLCQKWQFQNKIILHRVQVAFLFYMYFAHNLKMLPINVVDDYSNQSNVTKYIQYFNPNDDMLHQACIHL